MASEELQEKYTKDAAYFEWLNRTRAGRPGTEYGDWVIGKLETMHHFEMADLCMRLLRCADVDKKIELAVMFFAAEAIGWRIEPMSEHTLLPNDREAVKKICRQASFAATNLYLPLPRGARHVGELIAGLQAAYRKFNGEG